MKKHEKKYIDSEAFFKVINTLPYKDTSYPDASVYNGAISDVADMLTHFPAADVVEVRHGKWEWNNKDEYFYSCSNCGHEAYGNTAEIASGFYNYCPRCGAKMVNEDDTD